MSTARERDRVVGIVRSFLDSKVAKDQPELAKCFEKIATANLPWSKPQTSNLSEQKERRLDHASKIQAKIAENTAFATKTGRFRLNAAHVATILILPIESLEEGGWLSHETCDDTLLHIRLNLMSNLMKHYLTKTLEAITMADQSPPTDPPTTDEPAIQSINRSLPERELRPRKSGTSVYREDSLQDEAEPSRPTKASKATKDNKDSDYKPDAHNRREAEKKKCRARDLWRCIFQRTAEGQVCHILPFTWNNTEKAIQQTTVMSDCFNAFFDKKTRLELCDLLMDITTLGKTDMAWNMFYLNCQLHAYWGQGRLGLFCKAIGPHVPDKSRDESHVGKDWVDVIIQFHWLKRRDGKPDDEMADRDAMDAMAQTQIQHEEDGSPPGQNDRGADIDAVRADTKTPVLSGHEVRIAMPLDDALKCKMMVDVQWAIIRIAAMSGAAGYPELLPDHRDWNKVKAETDVTNRGEQSPTEEPVRP
ncbi:uncharacterized protein B0J16DRAFT_384250 [Fusarium flagelliforme]|uniref:uncharacterized protein n=1 Tax=Fusarium flagelliforme TaxID=2675880 RepID=UPI001E8E5A3D|nr:uncharacterized protein B0J16DRAFT_384250 [Fusarium flagelliforme]KAH7185191.1 hypothetical protein B0J16DRAFT_384250 [Fusarium flagelliforme]